MEEFLETLLDNHIDIEIKVFQESGFDVYLYGTNKKIIYNENYSTIIELLNDLKKKIISFYPDSEFANKYREDINSGD